MAIKFGHIEMEENCHHTQFDNSGLKYLCLLVMIIMSPLIITSWRMSHEQCFDDFIELKHYIGM